MEREPVLSFGEADAESLDKCFKRLNLDNNEEDPSSEFIESLNGLILYDNADLPLSDLTQAILRAQSHEVYAYLNALHERMKHRKDEICESFTSDAFLRRLYQLLTTNGDYRVQIKALNIFSSLSSKSNEVSDRLKVVPIVERSFDLIRARNDISVMKEAFRVVGNVLGSSEMPANNLFDWTDCLLAIIRQSWSDLVVIDYAAWTLCNLWSFKNAPHTTIKTYVSKRGLSLLYIVGSAVVLFSRKPTVWPLTVWVCCIFLEEAVDATKDYSLFSQPGVIHALLKVAIDIEAEERTRFSALGLLERMGGSAPQFMESLIDVSLPQIVSSNLLVEGSSPRIQRSACRMLSNFSESSRSIARSLLTTPNFVANLQQRLYDGDATSRDKDGYARVLCSPILSFDAQDLLVYCCQTDIVYGLLEYALNSFSLKTRKEHLVEERILNSTELAVRKLASEYPQHKPLSKFFQGIDLLLYMLYSCAGECRNEVSCTAERTLKITRKYNRPR